MQLSLGVSGVSDILALIVLIAAIVLALIPPRVFSPWLAVCLVLLSLAFLAG